MARKRGLNKMVDVMRKQIRNSERTRNPQPTTAKALPKLGRNMKKKMKGKKAS
jgi:hypothetical protein